MDPSPALILPLLPSASDEAALGPLAEIVTASSKVRHIKK